MLPEVRNFKSMYTFNDQESGTSGSHITRAFDFFEKGLGTRMFIQFKDLVKLIAAAAESA